MKILCCRSRSKQSSDNRISPRRVYECLFVSGALVLLARTCVDLNVCVCEGGGGFNG